MYIQKKRIVVVSGRDLVKDSYLDTRNNSCRDPLKDLGSETDTKKHERVNCKDLRLYRLFTFIPTVSSLIMGKGGTVENSTYTSPYLHGKSRRL